MSILETAKFRLHSTATPKRAVLAAVTPTAWGVMSQAEQRKYLKAHPSSGRAAAVHEIDHETVTLPTVKGTGFVLTPELKKLGFKLVGNKLVKKVRDDVILEVTPHSLWVTMPDDSGLDVKGKTPAARMKYITSEIDQWSQYYYEDIYAEMFADCEGEAEESDNDYTEADIENRAADRTNKALSRDPVFKRLRELEEPETQEQLLADIETAIKELAKEGHHGEIQEDHPLTHVLQKGQEALQRRISELKSLNKSLVHSKNPRNVRGYKERLKNCQAQIISIRKKIENLVREPGEKTAAPLRDIF